MCEKSEQICEGQGHSPGPWKYIDATKVAGMKFAPACVIQAGDKQVARFSWNDNSSWFPNKEESQANAYLIAAAPDLLECANEFIRVMQRMDLSLADPLGQAFLAAVAKAEGRS